MEGFCKGPDIGLTKPSLDGPSDYGMEHHISFFLLGRPVGADYA